MFFLSLTFSFVRHNRIVSLNSAPYKFIELELVVKTAIVLTIILSTLCIQICYNFSRGNRRYLMTLIEASNLTKFPAKDIQPTIIDLKGKCCHPDQVKYNLSF